MRILAIRSRDDLREYARNARDAAFFRALREPLSSDTEFHLWAVRRAASELSEVVDRLVRTRKVSDADEVRRLAGYVEALAGRIRVAAKELETVSSTPAGAARGLASADV